MRMITLLTSSKKRDFVHAGGPSAHSTGNGRQGLVGRFRRILTTAALLVVSSGFLFSCTTMEKRAKTYVEQLPDPQPPAETITESDIADLPPVVQRYFRYSNVIGKPKIDSFSFTMTGKIRQSADAKWMDFTSRQYNLISEPSRVYYVRGQGTPMSGVDSYIDGKGRMHIKLFNLISVGDSTGPEMDQSALVSFLNDMSICPPAYFSAPVEWEQVGPDQAKLRLSHRGMTVEALLTFDQEGRLLNWETDDRYADVDGQALPDKWSTPMTSHGELAGLRIPLSGRGVHNYDGTPFDYVQLEQISELEWNRKELPQKR